MDEPFDLKEKKKTGHSWGALFYYHKKQLGGPDGELAASMRYLHQRYGMPYNEVVGILTDVGTEELAHLEMIAAIIYQLTRNISVDNIKGTMFEPYYVDHTTGLYPIAASGVPFDMKYVGIKGDVLADLAESQAAEQKARVTEEVYTDHGKSSNATGVINSSISKKLFHKITTCQR